MTFLTVHWVSGQEKIIQLQVSVSQSVSLKLSNYTKVVLSICSSKYLLTVYTIYKDKSIYTIYKYIQVIYKG